MPELNFAAALMAGVLVGAMGGWAARRLEARRPALRLPLRAALSALWIGLGSLAIILALAQAETLLALGWLALGVGMAASGVGQTLDQPVLQRIGAALLPPGMLLAGIAYLGMGQAPVGVVAIALSLCLLLSLLRGWIGAAGRLLAGVVLIAAGVIALALALAAPAAPADLAVGAGTLLLGVLALIVGGRSLARSVEPGQPS